MTADRRLLLFGVAAPFLSAPAAVLVAALVFAVTAGSPLGAQEAERASAPGSVLVPGTLTRLTSSTVGGSIKGRVTSVDARVLNLAGSDGRPLQVPLDSLISLEVSVARKRNTLKGLLIGAGVGLVLGAVANVDPEDCGVDAYFCSRGGAIGGMLFSGAALGAGVGALVKSDLWQPVVLDRARVSLAPRDGRGLVLTVAIRF